MFCLPNHPPLPHVKEMYWLQHVDDSDLQVKNVKTLSKDLNAKQSHLFGHVFSQFGMPNSLCIIG